MCKISKYEDTILKKIKQTYKVQQCGCRGQCTALWPTYEQNQKYYVDICIYVYVFLTIFVIPRSLITFIGKWKKSSYTDAHSISHKRFPSYVCTGCKKVIFMSVFRSVQKIFLVL